MKIERTKNTFNNMIWGFAGKVISMIGPFLVQTAIIYCLGMEYNGLTGLFSSVINVLNLAELGIGTAIVYSLYNAIAEDDTDLICKLLAYYKKVYHIIGLAILAIGLAVIPFIKIICREELPGDVSIYVVYLICLVNVVLSYNLFAYQQAVLNALQMNSIIDRSRACVNVTIYILQVLLLVMFKNYYYYVLTLPIQTIIANAVIYYISRSKYPEFVPRGYPDKDTRKEVLDKTKALFLYRIGTVVLVSVDSMVVSAYLGLHVLGRYSSYSYIINALTGFIIIIFNSMLAGIGNSIATESVDKNREDFYMIFFCHRWLMGWMTATLLCLFEPFMKLWIGEKELFPMGITICFVAYFFFMQIGNVINVYRDAGGLWEYDKWRPLVAAVFNLVLNLTFVSLIGMYAIILSTIAAILVIIIPWATYITYKNYFKHGIKDYILMMSEGIVFTASVSAISYYACSKIGLEGIAGLLVKLIVASILSNILFFIVYSKTKYYAPAKHWFIGKIRDPFDREKCKKDTDCLVLLCDGGISSQIYQYVWGQILIDRGYRLRYDVSFFGNNGRDQLGRKNRFFLLDKLCYIKRFEAAPDYQIRHYKRSCLNMDNQPPNPDWMYIEKDWTVPAYLGNYYKCLPQNYVKYINEYIDLKTPEEILDTTGMETYRRIVNSNKSVGVHIRRGDMVVDTDRWKVPGPDYFIRAMEKFGVKDSDYFIFSDDLDWVKENIVPLLAEGTSYTLIGSGDNMAHQDLFLLSVCKNQIASQGSFGYVAFVLNRNPGKMLICPDDGRKENVERLKGENVIVF